MTTKTLTDPRQALAFMTAGNAKFTLRSVATGTRFTFKAVAPKSAERDEFDHPEVVFVKVLTGADNTASFEMFGMLFRDDNGFNYRPWRKARVGNGAPSVKGFCWFFAHTQNPDWTGLGETIEFWHEGRCGRCGRDLTVPESIEAGFGPVCAEKITAWA